ncbi:MAG: TerB family tellurite resistance protein [Bacteroidetes bacterium]|nr:TerB family tellurite resistance protein [Bacteroidota bacterium]
MEPNLYKEAILCLMFSMAEADTSMSNEELMGFVTMKDVFAGYTEPQIITLYNEYKKRFTNLGFAEKANVFVTQIPQELHMATLSLLADVAVVDFNVDVKEGSLISVVASTMSLSHESVKTLLLAALSKKLLLNMNETPTAGLN